MLPKPKGYDILEYSRIHTGDILYSGIYIGMLSETLGRNLSKETCHLYEH